MREYPNVYIVFEVLEGDDSVFKIFYNKTEADDWVAKQSDDKYRVDGPYKVE